MTMNGGGCMVSGVKSGSAKHLLPPGGWKKKANEVERKMI
jgi:hypothetical protein